MPGKEFSIAEGLSVVIFKRRDSRSMRLTVGANGTVRVTIPAWAPYRAGVEFARSRRSWIAEQQVIPDLLREDQAIGKAHHLHFVADPDATKPTSRVSATRILIRYRAGDSIDDDAIQEIARKACIRALRTQAERLLPQRLATLAQQHHFMYNEVSVKQLKGRWGSCDQHQNIVLNLYLMQLPWELIDYVLLHELVHTRILRHGPDFWNAMEEVLPNVKALRKQIRERQPVLS